MSKTVSEVPAANMPMIDKRSFLTSSAGFLSLLLGSAAFPAFAQQGQAPADAQEAAEAPSAPAGIPFDWEALVARMKAKAETPYVDNVADLPEVVHDGGKGVFEGHRVHVSFG